MEKIIRKMDQFSTWVEFALINEMELKLVNHHYEEGKLFLTILIRKGTRVYSYIKQLIQLTKESNHLFDFTHFDQKEFKKLNAFLTKMKKDINVNQKIYMSYTNEEESKLFNLDIGEQILIIEKKISLEGYLSIDETEVNKSNSSIFREGYI